MHHFLDFYFNSISIVQNMLVQFSAIANLMISPNDTLTKVFGFPVSIISVMVGAGVSVYIARAIVKFFII